MFVGPFFVPSVLLHSLFGHALWSSSDSFYLLCLAMLVGSVLGPIILLRFCLPMYVGQVLGPSILAAIRQ